MIRLCITGVPGTGKTSLCNYLRCVGIECVSADQLARNKKCIDGDTVDIDCLRERIGDLEAVEGHYSHLLGCRKILILTCLEEILEKRLSGRGYSSEKIMENIEAQRSGTIFFESLDLVPSQRIMELETSHLNVEEIASRAIIFLKGK